MNVDVIKETLLVTTPLELRLIADEMEKLWSRSKPGEEVPKVTRYGKGCKVTFAIDQEEMYNQEHRKKVGKT